VAPRISTRRVEFIFMEFLLPNFCLDRKGPDVLLSHDDLYLANAPSRRKSDHEICRIFGGGEDRC